jgi:hypothetical protein
VTAAAPADPLPSWRDGATKATVLGFFASATDPASSSFLAPADRVAAFDNDGTLWVEKPFPPEQSFAFERVRELAREHREWQETQPFQAILAGDQARLARMSQSEEIALVGATHTGMTPLGFRALARSWLDTWTDPRFGKHPGELVYQPMLELLAEARRRGFAEYVCSGDTIEFLRAFTPERYGVPEEHVVGTGLVTEVSRDARPVLVLQPGIVPPYNTSDGKPVNVQRMVGRMPAIVVGNEDGDLPLLEVTAASNGPRLLILIHHDDAEREYAYDKGAERALRTAREHGWTVVSMKRDFATIFPTRN